VTIGSATRDVFLESSLFKVLNDPVHLKKIGFPTGEAQCFALGSKIEVDKPVLTIGGGAANAGVTFVRQGFSTSSFVRVGDDQNGKAILEDLRSEKITPLLIKDKKFGTSYSVVLLSPSGERTILNYRGASEHLEKKDLPISRMKADVAYIAPGRISFSVMTEIIKVLKKNRVFIAMNPSKYYLEMGAQRLKPILNALGVVILNKEEASYLTGYKYNEEKKMFKKFDELVEGIAVMTDGPRGVLVSDGKMIYKAGIYKDNGVKDRTGAGDAFGSGFVAGLFRGRSKEKNIFSESGIMEGIKLGTANATSVVEQIGAQGGILTKNLFLKEKRWKTLPIKKYKI